MQDNDGLFLYNGKLVEKFGSTFFHVLNYDSKNNEIQYGNVIIIYSEDYSRLIRMPLNFEILVHYI